ncbi:histidine phosphatase family protein [Aquabacterium sp.]|jgi:2,3-bisphosphoglycerate-dependent phosphoglycerate mutase|uniref:histidine phosphatase family protein n=1 Tax=Aquabacterium sp. TaxID=1872578 RepID=UPI002486D517|nr:histidine phosphatase family protein [Aquabacterium sp.]MDI1350798.1 histidine phosphatase family protein [Aquabacterium sp.]
MSESATRLIAVRHGETAWNRVSRIQGHTDIPLNDAGLWQARQVGEAVAAEGIDAIYSSDLQRAADTARAIGQAAGVPVQLDVALRERHFGELEGLTHDEINTRWPEQARRWRGRDPDYGPQGGETLKDFHARCVGALTRLAQRHPGQTVVLVAHGGVLDCFYRAANGVDLSVPRSWTIGNATINRLLYSPDGLTMIGWADDGHLQAERGLDESSDGAVAPA